MGYKKLAIIGNGFDIAHKLKAMYHDFYSKMPDDLKMVLIKKVDK